MFEDVFGMRSHYTDCVTCFTKPTEHKNTHQYGQMQELVLNTSTNDDVAGKNDVKLGGI